ncbi:hypothetical protein CB1_001919007 [Camelus ferus]|nr:hypothetical protein CB1_001919007 [Camelus ferus]
MELCLPVLGEDVVSTRTLLGSVVKPCLVHSPWEERAGSGIQCGGERHPGDDIAGKRTDARCPFHLIHASSSRGFCAVSVWNVRFACTGPENPKVARYHRSKRASLPAPRSITARFFQLDSGVPDDCSEADISPCSLSFHPVYLLVSRPLMSLVANDICPIAPHQEANSITLVQ